MPRPTSRAVARLITSDKKPPQISPPKRASSDVISPSAMI